MTEGFWTKDRAKAYITAVPKDRHLILDLDSPTRPQFSRLESYFGHPFVYCMIHNFGGQNSLFGYLPSLNKGVVAALRDNVTAYRYNDRSGCLVVFQKWCKGLFSCGHETLQQTLSIRLSVR